MAKNRIYNPYTRLEGYNCFGCSPLNRMGLQMEFYEEGEYIISEWEPADQFSGYKKILHGGIQATLLDETASWTVQVKLRTGGVTANIDLRYKRPVFVTEGKVLLRGKVLQVEKRIAVIATELLDSSDNVCCKGIIKYFIYPEEVAREKLYYPEFERFFKKDS